MTARLTVVARRDLAPVYVADRDLAVLPDLARALGRHGLVTVAKTTAAPPGAAGAPSASTRPDATVQARTAHPAARSGPPISR